MNFLTIKKPAAIAGFVTLFSALLLLQSGIARAVDIQTVKSDKGITALLVEDYTVPLIALRFSFKGGYSQDLPGKAGTANF